ncbi:MAG: PAS domain S-box protein [Candidatus Aminicenantes bacterium]|nr:PAS domain S-box protein [Candidatus Aminicenantes bacterium]
MKKTVLIVDDVVMNTYILKILLEKNGFDVVAAANGREALEKAGAHPPDLIVSDILMPVMDGYALCRRCKSDERLKRIPFVFYTASFTEQKDERFALSLGADRFLLKPQEPGVLLRALQEVLCADPAVEPPAIKPLGEELEFFRSYNEVLFNKLEKKMLDLEIAKRQFETLAERYRLSFENVSDVIYMIDTDLVVQSISPSVEKMLGFQPQDFIGRQVADLKNVFTPESFAKAILEIGLILNGETVAGAIYEFVAKDGAVKIGEVSGSPVRHEGKIVGMIAVARDVSDRKRAEDQLRQSEARFRSYFELPLIGIAITSPEKGWIEVNDRLTAMLGYSRPELNEMAWSDLTHPEDLAVDVDQFNRVLAGEIESYMIDKRFIRKSGEVLWTSLAAGCVRKQDGTVDYFVALVSDITDRMKSSERLRKSLHATVHAIAVTVETKDPYTAGHQRRVADLAGSIAVEMGLSGDQIEGIRMAAVIHDIGKISVPTEILSSPRKLSAAEFSLIKTHVGSGYEILKDVEFPWPIARMVLEHHERIDGSGYPEGLTRDEILIESRVIAVADVVEAMASNRPYRPSVGIDFALEEITKNKAVFYDPEVVDACLRLFKEKGYRLIS